MQIPIRAAHPDTDYPAVAALLNLVESQPVTPDTIRSWDAREGFTLRRAVATLDDEVAGYGVTVHAPWAQPGRFFINVIVRPDQRGQGIGALLYDDGLAFARSQGATCLDAETRDDSLEGLRFAEQRGFHIDHQMFESVIDLATFDERPFTGLADTLAASGIRIFSLADVGDTREARYRLWEVNYATSLTDPASTGTFPGFEEMMDIWAKSDWFIPEGQFLAADGDRYVGLAAVGYFRKTNSMHNMMTGVIPDYRGRKIAQALKLHTIRFARAYGADRITTTNESSNAAMLAINRKLGYVPQPGMYRLFNPQV